ncbi:MAG: hypothetical protein KAY24_01860 [Candidatus Eisenbacteria sp.]|nr:hypothetical protein [Candidatus Eisenbacteria bacterium]
MSWTSRCFNVRLSTMVAYPTFLLVALFLISFCGVVRAQDGYDPAYEIAAIQAEIDAHGYNWTAGETSMNQIPPEERLSRLGLLLPPGESGFLPPEALEECPSDRDLPTVWDWRLEGGVTPVKNQGSCGSCWDFAATAAFESVIRVYTGIEVDLSEQQVLSCNTYGYGCAGGLPYAAYELFMFPGAVAESCMPYVYPYTAPCTQHLCDIIDVLDGYHDIPNNITSLKEHIYDHPVAAGFTVYDDFFSYNGGCYEHEGGSPANHAILLVGWDDNMCEGEGAWIIKNSWGIGWGLDGYAYVKFGTCNVGAFAQEIFYSGVNQVHISHQALDNTFDTTEPYEVVCEVIGRDFPVDDSTVYLHYDVGAGWIDQLMSRVWDGETATFRGEIPPQALGTFIKYWLSAADTDGYEDVDPTGAPENFHEFAVINTVFADDAEEDRGWTFGAPDDDATGGFWERGVPEGTWGIGPFFLPGNPEEDHTPPPGVRCFCTGCEAGGTFWDYDVDGGKTTLISPEVDLREMETATLIYYRWYTNNAGQYPNEDYWQVDVTNDGGENWVNLEYTNMSEAIWREMTFDLHDYLPLDARILIRFVASDYNHPSNVEGAVDDVEIISIESATQGADSAPIIHRIRLEPGRNPVTGSAILRYEVPSGAEGELRIYAVNGRCVRTLLDGMLRTGSRTILWDGRDDHGRDVPAGLYLIRLSAASEIAEGRLLRLR